jgi:hypothetical protein
MQQPAFYDTTVRSYAVVALYGRPAYLIYLFKTCGRTAAPTPYIIYVRQLRVTRRYAVYMYILASILNLVQKYDTYACSRLRFINATPCTKFSTAVLNFNLYLVRY